MSAEQTPDIAALAAVLAEHREDPHYPDTCICEAEVPDAAGHHVRHVAAALDAAVREAEQRATSLVRLVEQDMSEAATLAWRSAEARRGLSDYDALLVHADALTRWSERIRMALKGDDYRADRITEPVSHEAATSGEEASKA